nr:MAG TPA_asm: hypothetical protein [Caudoviricetes sp.]
MRDLKMPLKQYAGMTCRALKEEYKKAEEVLDLLNEPGRLKDMDAEKQALELKDIAATTIQKMLYIMDVCTNVAVDAATPWFEDEMNEAPKY